MSFQRQLKGMCLIGALLITAAPAARAQEQEEEEERLELPDAVRVVVPGCPLGPFEIPRLVELLEVELGQSGVALGHGESTPPERTALVIVDVTSCEGENITLRIEHLGSSRSVDRELLLTDTPFPERSRVIALAMAELLRAAWGDLSTEVLEETEEPEERAPSPQPLPPQDLVTRDEVEALQARLLRRIDELERARQDDEQPRGESSLAIAGGVRLFPAYDGTFTGVRIAGSFRLGNHLPLRLNVDAELRYGSTRNELGEARAYLPMAWATLLATSRSRRMGFAAGVGLGVGWAWAQGEALDLSAVDASMNGFVLAAVLRGGLEHAMTEWLSLQLIVEAGYVIVGVTPLAADDPILGVAGPLITIDLGLSFSL